MRVGIVGCGTAGPAAAIGLARAGHEVEVLERVPEPSAVGAGILVQPTGMTALARLGLLAPVIARGDLVERLHGVTLGGRDVLDLSYADLDPRLFGIGLHRGALFEVLVEAMRAEGVPLRAGIDVEAIDGRHLVDAGGGRHGPYDLVIVADGARSELRGRSRLRKTVVPYPFGALWIVAPDPERRFSGTLFQVYEGVERMLGFLPTGRLEDTPPVSLFWSLHGDEVEATRAAGLDAFAGELARFDERAPELLAGLYDLEEVPFARYWDVRMPRVVDDGVVYLGDAAHAMSPQLGQGANLALYDAMVLADCLAEHPLAEALAAYDRLRRDHLRTYQFFSRWLTPAFQSRWPLVGALRDAFMGPACRFPYAKRRMLETLAGLSTGFFGAWPLSTVQPYPDGADRPRLPSP